MNAEEGAKMNTLQELIGEVQGINKVLEIETVVHNDRLFQLDLEKETREKQEKEEKYAKLVSELAIAKEKNKELRATFSENVQKYRELHKDCKDQQTPQAQIDCHRLIAKLNFSRELAGIILGTVPPKRLMDSFQLSAKMCDKRDIDYYIKKAEEMRNAERSQNDK